VNNDAGAEVPTDPQWWQTALRKPGGFVNDIVPEPTPPLHASPSYQTVVCCGRHRGCDRADSSTAADPCWGVVGMDVIEGPDGMVPLHACTGHYGYADGDPYTPEPAGDPPRSLLSFKVTYDESLGAGAPPPATEPPA